MRMAEARKWRRKKEAEGWAFTKSGHGWCAKCPQAAYPVFLPDTPSDRRSFANADAELRRALAKKKKQRT